MNILFLIAVILGGTGVACFVKASQLPDQKNNPLNQFYIKRGVFLYAVAILIELVNLYQYGLFDGLIHGSVEISTNVLNLVTSPTFLKIIVIVSFAISSIVIILRIMNFTVSQNSLNTILFSHVLFSGITFYDVFFNTNVQGYFINKGMMVVIYAALTIFYVISYNYLRKNAKDGFYDPLYRNVLNRRFINLKSKESEMERYVSALVFNGTDSILMSINNTTIDLPCEKQGPTTFEITPNKFDVQYSGNLSQTKDGTWRVELSNQSEVLEFVPEEPQ